MRTVGSVLASRAAVRRLALVLLGSALTGSLAACGGTASQTASSPAPGHRAGHGQMSGQSMSGRSMSGMRGIAHGTVVDRLLPAGAAATGLVDQHGRSFTLRSLRGRIVAVAPLPAGCGRLDALTAAQLHEVALVARQALVGDRVTALGIGTDRRRVRQLAGQRHAQPNLLLAAGPRSVVGALWPGLRRSCGRVPVLVLDPSGHVRWTTAGRPGSPGGWDADRVDEAVAYVHDAPAG